MAMAQRGFRDGQMASDSAGDGRGGAAAGAGAPQPRRASGSDNEADVKDDDWGSECSGSDAGATEAGGPGGARRPDGQLDYELAHVAIDTIALYKIKCKRGMCPLSLLYSSQQYFLFY